MLIASWIYIRYRNIFCVIENAIGSLFACDHVKFSIKLLLFIIIYDCLKLTASEQNYVNYDNVQLLIYLDKLQIAAVIQMAQ